jgi:hypothetical protein
VSKEELLKAFADKGEAIGGIDASKGKIMEAELNIGFCTARISYRRQSGGSSAHQGQPGERQRRRQPSDHGRRRRSDVRFTSMSMSAPCSITGNC